MTDSINTPSGGYVAELVRRLSINDLVEPIDTQGLYSWKPHGHEPAVLLELNEADVEERISQLRIPENAAAFGSGISTTEAAWRLLIVHLIEEYETLDQPTGRIVVEASGVTTR